MKLKELLTIAAVALGLAFVGVNLTGCNTTEGFGEDVQSAGKAIEHGAEDSSD